MIYFDNAATGGFKPRAVTDAAHNVIRYLSANPGRSGHRLSLTGAEIVYETRKVLGDMFNANPDRVIFTKNCTEALNQAIFGLVKPNSHVITTVYEHNSVLRPLFLLKDRGLISIDVVIPSEKLGLVESIKEKITDKTSLIVTTATSNVTGEIIDVKGIANLAKSLNIDYVVDGAQAGGHIKIDVGNSGITALALACHKGLYGIMGSGALILSDNATVTPTFVGGTGSESFNLKHPDIYPDALEYGTLNLPAIASLLEGAKYVQKNFKSFSKILLDNTTYLIDRVSALPSVTCYSSPNPSGIVSFRINHLNSNEVADILNKEYDVAVRAGIHCAPLLHQYLNTVDSGLVRASLSAQNTSSEIRCFVNAIKDIILKSS